MGRQRSRSRKSKVDATELSTQKENARLKRQVSRLRKLLADQGQPSDADTEADEGDAELSDPTDYVLVCPECDSDTIHIISTPSGKRFHSCSSCHKWRSPVAEP